MEFPPILNDFSSIDGASFDFDEFFFGMDGVEYVKFGAGTSATAGAIETTRTSGGGHPYPSGS